MEATDLLLDMKDNHKALLLEILERHVPAGIEVWAFGSRARWTARETSDLDLVLRNPASLDTPLKSDIIDTLKEALDESDLPFLVDLLDWATVSEKFRTVIEREYVVVRKGKRAGVRDGWKSITWGELVTLEYGKSLRDYQNGTGEIPVYGTNGPIGFTDKPLCHFPSVIIGRKGAYRGVHYSDKPFFVIDTAFYLKPTTDQLDLKFAYYQLLTQDINSMDSGSAIPSTSREDFYNLKVDLPPLPIQRRIAAILSALDEKIELNRQTNRTLEAIAQALFKEWFVDFNFPGATGEMQESELGPIPVGWKVAKLGDIVRIKHGFAFKGDYFSEEETNDILITPGNFRIGGGFNYSKFKYYDGEYPSEYLLNRGDLIVTMTDLSKEGDTLGYPALVPQISGKNLLHNQRIGKIDFIKNSVFKAYLYFTMCQNNYRNYVLSGATGTTVKHTSPGRICDYILVIPTAEILQQFEEIAQLLIDNIEFTFLQNLALAQTRDTFLPKLMNGEIMV